MSDIEIDDSGNVVTTELQLESISISNDRVDALAYMLDHFNRKIASACAIPLRILNPSLYSDRRRLKREKRRRRQARRKRRGW